MLRILTRLWSEDSSTNVSIEIQSQVKEGTPKPRPTKRKRPEQNQNTKTGGEESVEKPDTSLARQFKHLNRKQEEPKTPKIRNQPRRHK